MKRWNLKRGAFDLDGLTLEEAAIPQPGLGEVRVKIHAVSLNYRDQLVLTQDAWRTDMDLIPVADGAGVIDAVGEGVTLWAEGDRVITVYMRDFPTWPPVQNPGMGLGSGEENGVLAEYVVLPALRLAPAPPSFSMIEAATLPCAAHTAWTSLQMLSRVPPGGKVLILGSGGVSLFALSIARALGIEAFITTGQEDKRERLLALGASAVVNYKTDADWGNTIYKLTGGVDKVVNSAGSGSTNQAMAALKNGGNVVTVGLIALAGSIDDYLLLGKGLTIHGIPVGGRDGLLEMVAFVEASGVRPVIHKTFAFQDAKAAYDEQLSPELFGKIVIEVA